MLESFLLAMLALGLVGSPAGGVAPRGALHLAERWTIGRRIRDVAQAPDGSLWMLEDANPGALIHATPLGANPR